MRGKVEGVLQSLVAVQIQEELSYWPGDEQRNNTEITNELLHSKGDTITSLEHMWN